MSRSRVSLIVGSVFVALLAAAVARGDIIHLKSGRLEGKVIERTGGRVKIRTTAGIIATVDEKEVLAVVERETPRDIYDGMAGKLGAKDAEGHFALAMWCRDHDLKDKMTAELVATLKISPDHERARRELGHVKTDKGWVTREEAMRAKGMVLVRRRWLTKEQAERLEQQAKNRRLVRTINELVRRIRTSPSPAYKAWEERLAAFDNRAVAWKILGLLDYRVPAVRRAACTSLARMKHHDAIPGLVRLTLLDAKESVRDVAMNALLQLDHERTCDVLYHVIAGVKLRPVTSRSDQRLARRYYRRIALLLGGIGDVRSVPFLTEILYPRIEIVVDGVRAGSTSQFGVYSAKGGPEAVNIVQGTTLFGGGTLRGIPRADRYYFNQAAENALKRLTGQDLGVLPRDWRRWWRHHGAEVLRKREAEKRGGRDKADKLLDEAAGGAQ